MDECDGNEILVEFTWDSSGICIMQAPRAHPGPPGSPCGSVTPPGLPHNPMRVLLIDNYDSYTFNLFQYLQAAAQVVVIRNDSLSWYSTGSIGMRSWS